MDVIALLKHLQRPIGDFMGNVEFGIAGLILFWHICDCVKQIFLKENALADKKPE